MRLLLLVGGPQARTQPVALIARLESAVDFMHLKSSTHTAFTRNGKIVIIVRTGPRELAILAQPLHRMQASLRFNVDHSKSLTPINGRRSPPIRQTQTYR